MKKLFLLAALCVAATFSACSRDDCEPLDAPDKPPLTIAFAEGDLLQFDAGETKTVHYTITGGNNKTVVTAEMQTPDGAYTLSTASTSATEGTIKITAKTPTDNRVLITVSDGLRIVTTIIIVSTKPSSQKLAITFAEGKSLQFDAGETKTVHYTITGGSDKTVVKAKMQKSDNAYTLSTASTSATQGTITITAKTPETENRIIVTVSDGSQTVTAEIAVSTNPSSQKLAITFAESNLLEFNVGETKTVHYTIMGGGANTVVKAEMQKSDGAYIIETMPISATKGTITITAKLPTENCVLVTVSDGSQTVTTVIAVSTKSSSQGITIVVETPGALLQLLAGYDKTKIIELTVIGNLNAEDIATLKNLPNLAILDMENVNLEELSYYAFQYKKSLTSVKLPKTLKTIGGCAFNDCSNLTSVTIPDSVTSIGEHAFSGCSSLTSITIPDNVTTIGEYAFWGCSGLTNITIPDGVTSIENHTFNRCSGLTSVTIGNSVTTIGINTFYGCSSLKSITIPSRVTTIEYGAFVGCSGLTSVTIGNNVTSIGKYAFQLCSGLTSITIPSSVTSIGYGAFQNCSGLTNVTIPSRVTTIEDGAFAGCSSLTAFYGKFASSDNRCLIVNGKLIAFARVGLTSYAIPYGVSSIGNDAFAGCSGLTNVTIGSSVTLIGSTAFQDCNGLTNITIPSCVTTIGDGAFAGCSRLGLIYCKAQRPPSAGAAAFYTVSATLYIPTGCRAAYAAANEWKNLTIIETQF